MCISAVLLQHTDLTPHCLPAYLQVEDKVETLHRGTDSASNNVWLQKIQLELCISTGPASPLLPICRI